MLKLENIKKTYDVGGTMKVEALRGINLQFRKSEFVSILGPSGCGKTTLLNIIGGLDKKTSGDLFISERSTAHYGDRDWDNYRNHSIGFVFQSYNLIPHMDVLANVELAPTISGVSKAERRIRSVEALKKVGLGDQLHKKPNQLSGGQMQRVAIARALVNDPEILLADEPTGALDTATSVQIMELLKEIAKDRLIIMVTHNPEIAEEYSSRIIRLKDGLVVDDTNPYTPAPAPVEEKSAEPKAKKKKKEKMASMSFFTALSLSMKNLMTKKARTALVSFAGSIGIIGIALILSLSNGVQIFIDKVQEDTLSAYPLSINKYSSDTTAIFEAMNKIETENSDFEEDRIYPDDSLGSMMSAMTQIKTNNIEGFIEYFEEHKKELDGKLNAYKLIYDLNVPIYSILNRDGKDEVMQTNPTSIFDYMGDEIKNMMSSMTALAGGNTGMNFYQEMLEGLDGELINPVVKEQYILVGEESRWPEKSNEVVLVVGENNRISTMALYALGFMDPANIEEVLGSLMDPNKEYDNQIEEGFYYELDEFIGHTFHYVLPTDYFVKGEGQYKIGDKSYPIWNDRREQPTFNEKAFLEEYGKDMVVVGIIRPNPNATSTSINSPIAYTAALTREIIAEIEKTDLAIQQKATPDYDVFSGTTFAEMEFTKENIDAFLDMLEPQEKQGLIMMINQMMQSAFTEERLPSALAAMDDQSFGAFVKMYAPNYTKDTVGEFVQSLDETTLAQLIGMISAQSGQPVDAASLPAVLKMMPDESFTGIVMMFDKSAPKYTKETIPAFLEAIGDQGRAKMLDQFKQNLTVTEENLKQTLSGVTEEEYAQLTAYYLPEDRRTTYDTNLTKIGYQDNSRIVSIQLYAVDFNGKDAIKEFVAKYNDFAVEEAKKNDPNAGGKNGNFDEYKVEVSDLIGSLMSGINTIINAISYVLIAFVAISLVVSSLMIAIITYISVLERIKEIGILRSLGASKKNIRQVFNAETLIEGFISGSLGIIVTVICCIIANPIIHELTGLDNINATLPIIAVPVLIGISVLLNVIAGLVPAYIASKKDPVIALRTE